MIEEQDLPGRELSRGNSPAQDSLPTEPFACPHCGQMLSPACRVCVACKKPIEPSEIIRRPAPAFASAAAIPQMPPPPERPVRFPWGIFFTIMIVGGIVLTAVEHLQEPLKSKLLLLLAGVQVLTSVWVFYDALAKRIPKVLRWGLGTLLMWGIVFPWYLARRQRPEAPCPFVEAPVGPKTRVLLVILLLVLFLLVLTGSPPK